MRRRALRMVENLPPRYLLLGLASSDSRERAKAVRRRRELLGPGKPGRPRGPAKGSIHNPAFARRILFFVAVGRRLQQERGERPTNQGALIEFHRWSSRVRGMRLTAADDRQLRLQAVRLAKRVSEFRKLLRNN